MAKRSERLLNLMQALRRRRRPVTGAVLAEEMGVSLRSVYRDIETLKSMGAAIDGEAGVGFQLRAEHVLPPLMFTDEDVEACRRWYDTLPADFRRVGWPLDADSLDRLRRPPGGRVTPYVWRRLCERHGLPEAGIVQATFGVPADVPSPAPSIQR